MAYNPTPWKDKAVERPRTYLLQNNPDGSVTLIPAPGIVYEAGTPVNAVNLKKVEDQLVLSDQHINKLAGVHGSTSAPTPSRIMQRSPTGTAEIATPVNSGDIANKLYVDGRSVQTRVNGGTLEYWTGTEWRPVGGTKLVQRGSVFLDTASADIIISAVNTAKAFINFPTILSGGGDVYRLQATLTSATNLRLTTNRPSPAENISWEIIESY